MDNSHEAHVAWGQPWPYQVLYPPPTPPLRPLEPTEATHQPFLHHLPPPVVSPLYVDPIRHDYDGVHPMYCYDAYAPLPHHLSTVDHTYALPSSTSRNHEHVVQPMTVDPLSLPPPCHPAPRLSVHPLPSHSVSRMDTAAPTLASALPPRPEPPRRKARDALAPAFTQSPQAATKTLPSITTMTEDEVLMGFEKWMDQCAHFSFVLTMKGSVAFVSPSVQDILGYPPSRLNKKSFSKLCHPADFQPVLRELRESRQNYNATPEHRDAWVSLLFRARKSDGEYVWIEAAGNIMHEESRTRKVAILVGRPIGPPSLLWSDVEARGGLGDAEFWLKVSREGVFLHVGEGTAETLAFESAEIVGASFDQMTPPEDRPHVRMAIEAAFEGTSIRLEHRLLNRSMQPVEVVTVFHAPTLGSEPGRTIRCQVNTTFSDSERRQRRMSAAYSSASRSSTGSLTTAATSPSSLLRLALPDKRDSEPSSASLVPPPPTGDVFEGLHDDSAPNFHLLSHETIIENRRLKEELRRAVAVREEIERQRRARMGIGLNVLGLSLSEGEREVPAPMRTQVESYQPMLGDQWGLPSPPITPMDYCVPPSVLCG